MKRKNKEDIWHVAWNVSHMSSIIFAYSKIL